MKTFLIDAENKRGMESREKNRKGEKEVKEEEGRKGRKKRTCNIRGGGERVVGGREGGRERGREG